MGDETVPGVIGDAAPRAEEGSGDRAPVGADGVADRIRSRAEHLLRIVDQRAHVLLSRALTPTEAGEIVVAGEAMATLFGRIGHPDLARLSRELTQIFDGEDSPDSATAVRVAATCDDLRTLLDSAIGQYLATADRGRLLVVIGKPTEEVDALCWVAHTRGYAIAHHPSSLPTIDDRPDAVLVATRGGFTPALRTLLLAVGERWPSPSVVLHRGADRATVRRLAWHCATVLPFDANPGAVVDEIHRVVAASTVRPVAALCGAVPATTEQRLVDHGFALADIDDTDLLPEILGRSPAVVVLGPATGTMMATAVAHLVRAVPSARHNPIVWVDGRPDAVVPAPLDVTIVDDIDDTTAARLAAQLRRRAGEISEVGTVGQRRLEWAAAEVLIDRALVAAHRSGRHVALATIRFEPPLDQERINGFAEVLGDEFRLDDILAGRGDRTLVLALGGVPRAVATRRLGALLERHDLGPGEVRVGVALFPADGRSANDLVAAADQAADRAADHGGPTVVATTWRPEADEVDVMVVDADPVLSQVVVDLLDGSGLRAMMCHSGPEALAALQANDQRVTPRLLLLDLDVQGIDGLGMLRELRTGGLLPQLKVLLMMARLSENDLRLAFEIGAADVVNKPLSTTLLLHRVRLLLGEGR